jgi:hypothetical protein
MFHQMIYDAFKPRCTFHNFGSDHVRPVPLEQLSECMCAIQSFKHYNTEDPLHSDYSCKFPSVRQKAAACSDVDKVQLAH